MKKNLIKVAAIAGLTLVGQIAATDFRAPISTQLGPLHYTFDKLHKKKSNFSYFTTAHYRETNEAFMKSAFETHPLSKLIFGKSKFTIGEAFQGGSAASNITTAAALNNYNPYLDVTQIAPRVSYSEAGVFFGANWDYAVFNNKGRFGIRGSLPIRYVRMERDNEAEENSVGIQSFVLKHDQRFVNPFDASNVVFGTLNNPVNVITEISSYKLSLLQALKYQDDAGEVISYYDSSSGNGARLGSTTYNKSNPNKYGSTAAGGAKIPYVLINSQANGNPPFHKGGALLIDASGAPVPAESGTTHILYPTAAKSANSANVQLIAIDPATGTIPTGRAAAFTDQDYSTMDVGDLWVTTVNGRSVDPNGPIATSIDAVANLDSILDYYDSDVEQWLFDNNFVMATDEQTGLGDIPVEIFYEHSFNDRWRGEFCVGVKFPTGNGGSDYAGNPYRVQMGNGSHYELKLGALAAWQAIRCMNVKLDLSYNFALEATEQRKAAYKGATIKNFGCRADAKVDWSYFVGNLDFNFTHPKTKKINGLVGYQLYYKTEDNIRFKETKQTNAWLDTIMTLDNKVARMDTEAWAHRVRLEGSYNLSKYCTASVGSLWTFAGHNMPAESDIHVAWQTRF